jgi:ABC-type antimicrobial peptide transport system permease subunit
MAVSNCSSSVCRPTTFQALLDRQEVPFTVAAEIASGLGAVTLVLACIGLYGLVSFSIVRQTRDIGIRMALGARPGAVLGGVVRDASRSLMCGAAVGIPAAAAGLAWLESQVPMIDTYDLKVFVLVPALLFAAGVLTALVPARRAASLDPLLALRHGGE